MNYSHFVEKIFLENGQIVVEGEYEFNGVERQYEAVVDTVSQARTALQDFRADFRERVKLEKQIPLNSGEPKTAVAE